MSGRGNFIYFPIIGKRLVFISSYSGINGLTDFFTGRFDNFLSNYSSKLLSFIALCYECNYDEFFFIVSI